jgi:putative membrane protein
MKSSRSGLKIFICLAAIFMFNKDALAQYRDYYGWGMGPGMMGWGIMGWFGPIFMVMFWVLLIVLAVLLIRWLLSSGHAGNRNYVQNESAMEILKKRYARGEIDKEEFETKERDLS